MDDNKKEILKLTADQAMETEAMKRWIDVNALLLALEKNNIINRSDFDEAKEYLTKEARKQQENALIDEVENMSSVEVLLYKSLLQQK